MKFKPITERAYSQIKRLFSATDRSQPPGYWSRYLRYEPERNRLIAACGPVIRIETADMVEFGGLYEEGGIIYLDPDYFSGSTSQDLIHVPMLRAEEIAEQFGQFQYPLVERMVDSMLSLQDSTMSYTSLDLAVVQKFGKSLPGDDRQLIFASRGENKPINVYSHRTRNLLGIIAPMKIEDDQLSLFVGDEFKPSEHQDFSDFIAGSGIEWETTKSSSAPAKQGDLPLGDFES